MKTGLGRVVLALILINLAGAAYAAGNVSVEEVWVEPGEDIQSAIYEAMEMAEPGQRGRVRLMGGTHQLEWALGIYDVDLVGSGIDETFVELAEPVFIPSEEYYEIPSVFLYENASMSELTIQRPAESMAGSSALVFMIPEPGYKTELRSCRIVGNVSHTGGDVTGVYVFGGTRENAAIIGCQLIDLTYGVIAIQSGVNITRTLFKDIANDAVLVASEEENGGVSSKESGVTAPMLGTTDDLENTGFNQFRDVDGFFINNLTSAPIEAENNDWGVYSDDAIQAKVSGPANTSSFFFGSIGPGTVVASVLGPDGDPVPDGANPQCSIPAQGLNGLRDPSTLQFLLDGAAPGDWIVEAFATGYTSNSASVTVSGFSVSTVSITLTPTGGNGGNGGQTPSPSGCGAKDSGIVYAGAGLLIWQAGRRRRKRSRS